MIKDPRKIFRAGFGVMNILRPRQSFFNDNDVVLDRRLSTHVGGVFRINERVDALPSVLFSRQGTFNEVIMGGSTRYILASTSTAYRAVAGGLWYRNKDAGFISANLYYDEWTVGVSYDLNLSTLRPASRSRGGFEFSVIYIIKHVKLPKILKFKACPTYI